MSVTVTNSTNTLTITVGRQGPSGAGAQTAADIRALGFFDTSNDGTGSGLDADTVDGNEASALLARANHTGTQALSTISDAGTAAALDVGTGPNQVVQLNASSELPAVSGANLTNLPSGATQLSELSDVGATTATNRNVLVADGDSWESRALTEADISDLGSYITSVAAADITDATADGIALITSADANPFTDAEKSKLDSVESGANFTDATTIQAAGALMDSEVANLAAVKAFDPTNYEASGAVSTHAAITSGVHGISTFGASLIDDADAATARTTLGVDAAGTDNSTDVTLAGSLDYLSLSGQEITLGSVDLTTDVTGTLPAANGGTGVTALTSLNLNTLGSGAATDGYVATADGAGGVAWEAASGGGISTGKAIAMAIVFG